MSSLNPFVASNMKYRLNKFWNKRCVTITEYDPTYKVIYLGNVVTQWAKGEGCVDKPLATLWKNYCANVKHEIAMKITVSNSGLKATTKEHGLTEYWSNRITYCGTSGLYPRVFCWVYRHEGRKMKQELRCHAVLCDKEDRAKTIAFTLNHRLILALQEFRREKISRQKARLSLANACYENPSIPRRKLLLSTGSANFRPPMERSKSAPKLTAIDETAEEEEVVDHFQDIEDYTCGNGSLLSESTFSDVISDDIDSLSDQYSLNYPETDSLDSSSVDGIPPIRLNHPLRHIDENVQDSVSDESGYSEENDSFREDSLNSFKI